MHVLLLGASGRNGSLILSNLLSRSHTVTTLVRTPSSLTPHPNLTVVAGSPTSQPDLERALTTPTPPEVIITTLNQRRVSDSPFAALAPGSPVDLLEQAMRALIAAVQAVGGKPKIIVNSSQGVKESWDSFSMPFRLIFKHSTMRLSLKDHAGCDTVLRESGLQFVMPRPCRLIEGPAKTVKVWPDDGKGSPWMPTITRESVGKWLVDAAESSQWDGRAPVITN